MSDASPSPAAAVILWRDGPEGREAVVVRRGRDLRFAGGWHAFPGGRLDPSDAKVRVPGRSGEEAALVACAARELFEEAGVLLAAGVDLVAPSALSEARRALLGGGLTFAQLLEAHHLAVDPGRLEPAGRWLAPEEVPIRFDARLYLARAGPADRPEIWPGELSGGGFVPATRALSAWRRGEALLHPPTLHALRTLARAGPLDLGSLRAPPYRDGLVGRRIEFQAGIFLASLRTETLPPATHTNAWLLPDGEGGLSVVDPGATEAEEHARLFALLDELAAEGLPPRSVLLTHAHPDHVGAVAALVARYRIPLRAHPLAAARVGMGVEPLKEGDRLGRFLVLETPGHAREHLCFLDQETSALICGDMLSTLSTIVIDPPEGDMAEFVRQLGRLADLCPRTLYPAHGLPTPDGAERLRETITHRAMREALVVAALSCPGPLEAVTARAYADTPRAFHPVAARSCLASLKKLEAEGRAVERGGVWSAA